MELTANLARKKYEIYYEKIKDLSKSMSELVIKEIEDNIETNTSKIGEHYIKYSVSDMFCILFDKLLSQSEGILKEFLVNSENKLLILLLENVKNELVNSGYKVYSGLNFGDLLIQFFEENFLLKEEKADNTTFSTEKN